MFGSLEVEVVGDTTLFVDGDSVAFHYPLDDISAVYDRTVYCHIIDFLLNSI